jgi:hypothetical protein
VGTDYVQADDETLHETGRASQPSQASRPRLLDLTSLTVVTIVTQEFEVCVYAGTHRPNLSTAIRYCIALVLIR